MFCVSKLVCSVGQTQVDKDILTEFTLTKHIRKKDQGKDPLRTQGNGTGRTGLAKFLIIVLYGNVL